MDPHGTLMELGLSDVEASAALHYIADHLAGNLPHPPNALPLFAAAYRSGVRDVADLLRISAGDVDCETVAHHPIALLQPRT